MNEQHIHQTLATILARLQWIDDDDARSDWVKCFVAKGVDENEWARLIWLTEDVLDKLETIGGRPPVSHSPPYAAIHRHPGRTPAHPCPQ